MKLKLIGKKQEREHICSFFFEPEPAVSWKAGWSLQCFLPHESPDERGIDRFFTIASAPHERHIQITSRFGPDPSSSFKKALLSLPEGSCLEAKEPMGTFTLQDPEQEYILIAGGIGITPFRSILLDLAQRGLRLQGKLLYGSREQQPLFLDDLRKNGDICLFIEPARMRRKDIEFALKEYQSATFMVSGPDPMVWSLERIFQELRIPQERVIKEYFSGYGAG